MKKLLIRKQKKNWITTNTNFQDHREHVVKTLNSICTHTGVSYQIGEHNFKFVHMFVNVSSVERQSPDEKKKRENRITNTN